jgi:flagellar biosynthesis protein FlhF
MCVLIDTQGFAPGDTAAARDLATVLGRIAGPEVHLVLPASMKRCDAAAYSDHFAPFKPTRLLFTKLDETSSVGSMLSETLRLGIPLSFFSIGQGVPEDLENADPCVLIDRLFLSNPATAASAA